MWTMTVDRSVLRQNMNSGILDCQLPTTWLVRIKTWPLTRLEKFFEQTGNPKRRTPKMKSTVWAFASDRLGWRKTLQNSSSSSWFLLCQANPRSAPYSLGTQDDTIQQQLVIASLTQDVQPRFLLGDQVPGFSAKRIQSPLRPHDIPETYVAELNLSGYRSRATSQSDSIGRNHQIPGSQPWRRLLR